jgi:uncharacterized protein with PIN domain
MKDNKRGCVCCGMYYKGKYPTKRSGFPKSVRHELQSLGLCDRCYRTYWANHFREIYSSKGLIDIQEQVIKV